MAQFFPHSANAYAKMSLILLVGLVATLGLAGDRLQRSPYVTREGIRPEQPVPFSHQHHVGGEGIDCRYCHSSVENSAFAGIPPTKTCMNCHSQIWADAPMLEPVRQSYRDNTPLRWARVHDLPDFAYFNHEIHVSKGVGCKTCHGPVEDMPLMYQNASLQMEWCLDCHRNTAKALRPNEEVFNMKYEGPSRATPVAFNGKEFFDQATLGRELQRAYHIRTAFELTSCEVCHR